LPAGLQVTVDRADAAFISRASLWEIAIKISIGKLRLDIVEFAGNVEQHGFKWLDIKNSHLLRVAELPALVDHKDPFDRLLVAQSLTEPLTLLTTDQRLASYGNTVKVI
jgi:PIN domain nuclease of toxin-antitoxin system